MQSNKVIFLASYLGGGGAEKAMRTLNGYIKSLGLDSIFIAIEHMDGLKMQNKSEIVLCPNKLRSKSVRLIFSWFKLQKFLRKNSNCILVANCDLAELFALCSFYCKKIIVVEHSTHSWSNRRFLGRIVRILLYMRGVHFVSVSRSVSIRFLKRVNYRVIENVIQPILFDDEENKVKEARRLVFIGRLSREKCPDRFLDIVKDCNLSGLMIGSGPLEIALAERVTKEQIDVVFAGYQAKPWNLVRSYDALVVTSLFEGKPLIILEALSLGIKVFSVELTNLVNEFRMFDVDFCKNNQDFTRRVELWKLSNELDSRLTEGKEIFDIEAHNSRALKSWLSLFEAIEL